MRRNSPLQELDKQYYDEIKKRLESYFKIQIKTFTDCKIASQHLAEKKVHVSTHTLARMFGILKTKLKPYTATLNSLCRFLNFDSYAEFCESVNHELKYALQGNNDSFKTGAYSFVALELALANEDWKSMQELLESFHDFEFPENRKLIVKLGNYARIYRNKTYFKKLAEIEFGKILFFESFVDEDDPDGYYSDLLNHYYNNETSKKSERLFFNCFNAANKVYLNKSTEKNQFELINNLANNYFEKLNFHQLSRLLEVNILFDFKMERLNFTLNYNLDKICYAAKMQNENYHKLWIIARSIKALAHSDFLNSSLNHTDFKNLILDVYLKRAGTVNCIADLILQFVIHTIMSKDEKKQILPPPKKQQLIYYNEENSRITIESATAYLYAESKIKSILDKNLFSFAKKTGNNWLFNFNYFKS
jgi:hypothetical protein